MAQPVMVADLGTFAGAAAVVVGDRATLVRVPLTNAARWPGTGSGAVSEGPIELLSALRIEALRTVVSADSAERSASSGMSADSAERSASSVVPADSAET